MADIKRESIAKLCLALGLFVLAGVFRQLDRMAAPLPSAVCFLLTNLIYIGLAMSWGFSISRRNSHSTVMAHPSSSHRQSSQCRILLDMEKPHAMARPI